MSDQRKIGRVSHGGRAVQPQRAHFMNPLTSPSVITASEMITPGGGWQDVAYANGCLQIPLLPAEPKVFRITNRL
jgi:hypothetical protein